MIRLKRPLVSDEPEEQEKMVESTDGKPQLPTPRVVLQPVKQSRSSSDALGDEIIQRGIEGLKSVFESLGLDPALCSRIAEKYQSIDDEIRRISEKIEALEREKGKLLSDKEKLTRILRIFSEVKG